MGDTGETKPRETEESRKRCNEGLNCIGGCGHAPCNIKRSAENDQSDTIKWWYVKLESESSNYDSDRADSLKHESTWSNQGYDTEELKGSEFECMTSNDDLQQLQNPTDNETPNETEYILNLGPSTSSAPAFTAVSPVVLDEVFNYSADSSSSSESMLAAQETLGCSKGNQNERDFQKCFPVRAVRKKDLPQRSRKRKKKFLTKNERKAAEARRNHRITILNLQKRINMYERKYSTVNTNKTGISMEETNYFEPSSIENIVNNDLIKIEAADDGIVSSKIIEIDPNKLKIEQELTANKSLDNAPVNTEPPKTKAAKQPTSPLVSADSYKKQKMCIICETNFITTAFIHPNYPKVAHLCACHECARRVYKASGKCPICGLAAANYLRII